MIDFKDLEQSKKDILSQMEKLSQEMNTGIAKLPKEKRPEMLDILARAKTGKITVDEILSKMKQWQ